MLLNGEKQSLLGEFHLQGVNDVGDEGRGSDLNAQCGGGQIQGKEKGSFGWFVDETTGLEGVEFFTELAI